MIPLDQKDLMKLKGELKKEFEEIQRTRFWQDYAARLDDEREGASRHCETDKVEEVPKYQGMVRAIDAIKGLPAQVLAATPRKKQKEG